MRARFDSEMSEEEEEAEDVSIQFVDEEDMTFQEVVAFEGASNSSQQPAPPPEFVNCSVNETCIIILVEEEIVAPAPRMRGKLQM